MSLTLCLDRTVPGLPSVPQNPSEPGIGPDGTPKNNPRFEPRSRQECDGEPAIANEISPARTLGPFRAVRFSYMSGSPRSGRFPVPAGIRRSQSRKTRFATETDYCAILQPADASGRHCSPNPNTGQSQSIVSAKLHELFALCNFYSGRKPGLFRDPGRITAPPPLLSPSLGLS